jgi:hypothetical protein
MLLIYHIKEKEGRKMRYIKRNILQQEITDGL